MIPLVLGELSGEKQSNGAYFILTTQQQFSTKIIESIDNHLLIGTYEINLASSLAFKAIFNST